ncbi:hypothetical protein ANN_25078 [Periplaneta americana]|uniref:Uncharacterized protein n=1 Tax=Periplaneta americana TaxID=6978 RepID=A0ABQ8S0Z1_PERAM|nr:hypothetical protein ANN_25078 [Periplaneta americana]
MANFYGDLANQVASDDDSQISDVDPAELAKMVEDVDDLDADLFGSSLGKKRTPVTKTSVKSALKTSAHEEEAERSQKSHVTFDFPEKSSSFQKSDTKKSVKKNVDFGDFDADDPLGDLLSDEDDDFSNKKKKADIFKSDVTESPAKQDVKLSEPEPKSKQNKAKVIAELFGLEEEKKQQPTRDKESSSGWLGLQDPQSTEKKVPEVTKPINRTPEHVEEVKLPKKSPVPRQRSGKSGGDDDDGGDLLAGMGFDREKRSNTGNQPKSKLDELLGKSSSNAEDTTSRSMLDDLLGKKPSGRERMAGSDGKRNMPEQSQIQQPASGVSFGSYSPSVSAPSRRQSSRRNSGGTAALPDPLGIFSPSPSPKKENPGRQSSYSNPGHKTADWLGISDTSASSPAAAPAPVRACHV